MLSDIRKYVRKIPANRKARVLPLVISGIILPLIFIFWALSTHNAVDNVKNYSPTLVLFIAMGAASLIVLFSALMDLGLKMKGKKYDFPSTVPSLLSCASIIMTLAIASYILMPQLLRSGDTPPQLIMTESDNGMPGLAVVFNTINPTINAFEYRAVGGERRMLNESQASNKHWFQLTWLEPGKEYEYSINSGAPVRFMTPPGLGKPLSFAASGDPHFGADASRSDLTLKMAEWIKDSNYSMLFVLGDSAQFGFSDPMWKEAFGSISAASSSVPTEYVIGNHDAMFGGAGLYEDFLCPPGLRDKEKNCLTKRIDDGNVHFLVLDVEWELQSYTKEQKEWIVNQLSSIPKEDWCIVMSHTFYYSSGSHEAGWNWYDNNATINELTPLFENHSVDLVLSGHKHHTEILEKNNVTYLVIGSFGGPPDGERTYVSPESVWYRQGAYDFAGVTIENRTTATIRFIDSNNTVLFTKQIRNRN